jgi:hypothetical protein
MSINDQSGSIGGIMPKFNADTIADRLWEACRGVSKASAFPFITKALREAYKKGREDENKACLKIAAFCPDENFGDWCHDSIVRRIKEGLSKPEAPK